MENWQDATSRQVKLLTSRLNELLSNGLDLLHSELGVDLGLKAELIPPWVILLAACIGLVLMVALWASACRGLFKKPPIAAVDDGVNIKPTATKHVIKSEEQKKKKKKKTDKKAQTAQPNGRAVAEPQEEAIVPEEIVPHHQPPQPEVKAEKVSEVKKSKKKAKQVVKETKTVTADGKEPEEGTWETKVSNKEKREQRKKDKTSSDGSASPGGGDSPNCTPPEQPKAAAAPTPAGQKKKKVNTSETAAVVAGGLTDMAVKVPTHTTGQDPGHWSAKREPASLWGSEIDGSWTVIESGMKTSDLNLVSFTGLGVGTTEPQPVSDLPWLNQPKVADEWSGLNGGSVDPSSDWNAPSEVWGNYEEPTPELPAPQPEPLSEPTKVNLLSRAADEDEEDKDKVETAADGAAKTKKKKKKKKKAAEEGGVAGQEGEEPEKEVVPEAPVKKQQPVQEAAPAVQPAKTAAAEARAERPVKENISLKPPVTQVPQKPTDGEPAAKQNSLPAPQQKKPEESQAPKPAKKKKARRET
ncbi:protein LYRIC-like isoform 2-T2 [Polymixia lowei]